MTSRMKRFNSYLLAAVLIGIAGCATPKDESEPKSKTKAKGKGKTSLDDLRALMRLHVQVNSDGTSFTVPATVYRENPVTLTVMATPVIMEANLVKADLIEDTGGFAIRVLFDRQGALLLENATTSYRGSRLVVYGRWGTDKDALERWLGAVFIADRITDGAFTFTPDASREETEAIVRGLNNVAGKLRSAVDK